MTARIYLGDRVVVRYRLVDRAPADWRRDPDAVYSDVTGLLRSDGDPLVIDRAGTAVSIPRSAITSVRLLSAKPVRNSEIRDVEYAAAQAWPSGEYAWRCGWLLHAGNGSHWPAPYAIPLDRSAQSGDALTEIAHWYAQRNLPLRVLLPERLLPPGAIEGAPLSTVHLLTANLADIELNSSPAQVALSSTASPDRLEAYAHCGNPDDPSAIGRATVITSPAGVRWLGLGPVWTAPECRGSGHATRIVSELVGWGRDNAATHAYVQLDSSDTLSGHWYRRRGFGLHHRATLLLPTFGQGNHDRP